MQSTEQPNTPAATPLPGVATADSEVPLRCVQCGYDLRGLPGDRCPECGRADAVQQARLLPDAWHLRLVKRRCLWVVAGLFIAMSIVDGMVPDISPLRLVGGIALACTGYIWYRSDRRLNRYEPSALPAIAICLFLLLVIPLYLLSHRRWRSLVRCVVFGAACMLGGGALQAVVYFAVHGVWPF